MLTPEYLQELPDALVELYGEAEAAILEDMARRISSYDMFIPAAQHQMRMLEEMGAVREEIMGQLSALTGKSTKELERIMREAGMQTLKADDMIYKAAGLTPAPLSASERIQKVFVTGLKQTQGLFTNLTRTTANTATKQFEKALDLAYMEVYSGAFSPQEAVRSAVRSLCRQGVATIEYPSGHRDSMDVAVRRAVVTGVNQTCGKMQIARADEMGCDLMELTAHAGARPSHAAWQGQIVSRSGRAGYLSLDDIGYGSGDGFKGWNCSHDWRPYIEGMPRTYTPEMLQDYTAAKYEYGGKKMTEYEALQVQRKIERNIRKYKRENMAMQSAGLDTTESAAKLSRWQAKQKDFITQTGLKRQSDRESITGWGRSQASKASQDAKILKMMQEDVKLKAISDLPKKLYMPDTVLQTTLSCDGKGVTGVVPKGAKLTEVYSMAGPGTKNPVKDWKRLYNQYGGDPSTWSKMSGVVETDEYRYITHWYERDGIQVDGKISNIKRVKN